MAGGTAARTELPVPTAVGEAVSIPGAISSPGAAVARGMSRVAQGTKMGPEAHRDGR